MSEYTFVPWLRRGVAAEIDQPDTLGSDPSAGPAGRATLSVELTLATMAVSGAPVAAPSFTRDVAILGPADIADIKNEAILRTHPATGAVGATPGEQAYVDFYDEDFPWRYTPAHATASRLRPWIALLVLTDDEFTIRQPSGALPILTPAPRAVLPPVTETWAWAHAQLSRIVAGPGEVDQEITGNPDMALSRLMSPRRLVTDTAYHAFLVPAFEVGRLAGLGRDASQTPVQRPAWGTPAHVSDGDLPVYFRFAFTTGDEGDFETLARRLTPRKAGPQFGKRALDVSAPGFGMPDRADDTVDLEGALAPPDFDQPPRVAYADLDTAVTSELEAIVDASENRRLLEGITDPLVVPPLYGRWHAGVSRAVDLAATPAGEPPNWLVELNLDMRNRAAAGLGVEVVRERKEEYVQRAWEQVGAIEAANQRLREGELARGAADSLLRKHIAQAGPGDRILVLTSAAHAGLPADETSGTTTSMRGAIDRSAVPAAAQSPAFRRITRPQRPFMRRLTDGQDLVAFQDTLLTRMNAAPNAALSAAPPAPEPAPVVDLTSVGTAVADAVTAFGTRKIRPDLEFMSLTQTAVTAIPEADLDVAATVGTLKSTLTTAVNSAYPPAAPPDPHSFGARLLVLVGAISALQSDGPDRAIVTLAHAGFIAEFGGLVAGRTLAGLTVKDAQPAATVTAIVPVVDGQDLASFASDLSDFGGLVGTLADPAPPPPLSTLASLPGQVLRGLAPARTIGDRLASTLPVIADRTPTDPRRLAPVMAYPTFPDPLFEPLRALSQDHIIPNISDMPRDSMTVLEPNRRFIESFLAGVNHAFMAELLWREYPTDQRGTSFKVFWDTRDALAAPGREDIIAMDAWQGALGSHQPPALPSGVLVLVIRGELLVKYPKPFIYAQQAMWPISATTGLPDTSKPRVLDPNGQVRQPILHASLDPDIALAGFELDETEAHGHRPGEPGPGPDAPGWFFVIMERPGQPRFGLDDSTPVTGLQTWNDLAWDALAFPDDTPNIELAANAALAPAVAQPAIWGRTAADMAAILFQQPVLLARHASEMLP